jgi:adenylate cyclase class 2
LKEIEVKVPVKDFKEIKKILKDLKAEKKCKRTFEKNILFENEKLKIAEKGWVFRLRKFGKKNILTLKTKAKGKKGFKVREEININVDDFEKMEKFLKKIGFFEIFYYEKYREDYEFNGLQISLDKTPVGNYIELEGDYKKILGFLKKINVPLNQTLSLSYLQLFRIFDKKSNRMEFMR